ncbi:2,5-diketo-D-gluconate reductase A [Arthrobacter woluwensis]|uniref:aldo/keto reductase n=1 Tax=Arthrobacter woluwensis TaxID=156980 RepID=UPI0027849AF2|nr:aldo/keto reductase [Arthrobacter woluwensis]MDQ0708668.1 2,5-diketo-D-gluconate reductase A [Arthrobacter woluwensis]
MSHIPSVALNNGVLIPQLGFGLYKVPGEDVGDLVPAAVDAGYRHFDTAAMYGNELALGKALGAQLEDGSLSREDFFITSKVWNDQQGYDATLRSFDDSMVALGLDVLDLYLIHWPVAGRGLYLETYRALETLYREGRVRAIGVSNFQVEHLERVLEEHEVVPAVNQVELHPWLQQRDLRAFHAQHGITTEAWSPLARGALLEDPVLAALAAKHGKSVAQIALRWQIQEGIVVFPKASSAERIRQNADLFGFSLDQEDLDRIAGLDRDFRSGSHPDQVK